MKKYNEDKYDFKKYLVDSKSSMRVDELTFWKNNIPLPLDLVYKLFEHRNQLISLYLHHLIVTILYDTIWTRDISIDNELKTKYKSVEHMPTVMTFDDSQFVSIKMVELYNDEELKYNKVFNEISHMLLGCDFSFDIYLMEKCLNHEGRKYKRIYIPKDILEKLNTISESAFKYVGISNRDMFGNVVADYFNIYRSGFSDAFASIFNKLLDFLLFITKSDTETRSHHVEDSFELYKIKEIQSDKFNPENISKGKVIDGSLWEPTYINGKASFRLNNNHPYFNSYLLKLNCESIFHLIQILSDFELNNIKEKDQRYLEILRQNVSRELRLLCEE